MTHELELKFLREIDKLRKENEILKKNSENKKTFKEDIPTFQYSKIRDIDLEKIVEIERKLDLDIFSNWFDNELVLTSEVKEFLTLLLKDNKKLLQTYTEEDLKINFLAPLLSKVKFKSFSKEVRDFYEHAFLYKSSEFILKGIADFVVSRGLIKSKKPYFFIQEFKRSEDYSNPRPQLLAELISAVELNDTKIIKGAYIVGSIWNFVILERLARHKYQYFVSENFDSSKIHDLKAIYKNLLFVKQEIIEMIENGE